MIDNDSIDNLQKTVIQNIRKYFAAKKIKQIDFCRSTNYSERTLSQFLSGRTKLPRLDLMEAFMKFDPTLNLRWLFFNEGEMFIDEKIVVYKNKGDQQKESELVESLRKMIEHLMQEVESLKKGK